MRAGPPGKEEIGLGGERREGLLLGRGKRVLGWVTGFVYYFSLSISIYSLFSNLIQTKVEFKHQFEFKPHSIN